MHQSCICCAVPKPLEEFYKHPLMANGRLGRCKECHKREITINRNNNIDRVRAYDRARNTKPDRKEGFRKKNKRNNTRPFFMSAHNAVARAIKNGLLIRPSTCEKCPAAKSIQAHHDDHSKTLAVIWLCPICHAARHKELGRLSALSTAYGHQPEPF